MNLKHFALAALSVFNFLLAASAQDDPIIMTINGKPVPRSEFEYSYKKNNGADVVERKTVDEYVELFVNYKLKIEAALDAKLDTLSSYNSEFRQYRDQQVRPTLINDDDVEQEARKIYQDTKDRIGPDGLINPLHILLRVSQNDEEDVKNAMAVRADSIWNALKAGADWDEMAKKYSQDPGSASHGGEIGFVPRGQLVKEFEDAAFALQPGEMSKPVLTDYGYHIIKMKERKQMEPYEFHKDAIHDFIEKRGIREEIAKARLAAIATAQGKTEIEVMDERADSISAIDMNMRYLIKEYHDGLLMFEVCNRDVWEKASADVKGQEEFFKKNKKKYVWDAPRFKGIAYYTRDIADVNAVKKSVKGKKFSEWVGILRTTFNNDSILRIRVEKGVFKKGDNGLVDRDVFKVADAKVREIKDFPNLATFGKVLKAPEEMADVRALVVADYQDMMEKKWLEGLKAKYPVSINYDVLKTVKPVEDK